MSGSPPGTVPEGATAPGPIERPARFGRIGWVLLVVVVGGLIGGLLWAVHPTPMAPPPPPTPGPVGSQSLGRVATVVSAIDLALVVALVIVYVRTYLDTRARFALGLVAFLLALVVQALASSPPILGVFGYGPGGLGGFYFVASVFEAIALAVFLYLSLA